MATIRTVFAVLGDGIPTYWAVCAPTDPANTGRDFVVQSVKATLDVIQSMNDRGLFGGAEWRARYGAIADSTWIQEDPHRHPNDPASPKRLMQGGVGDRYRQNQPDGFRFSERRDPERILTPEQRRIRRLEQQLGISDSDEF
jgi:hypothetical protein